MAMEMSALIAFSFSYSVMAGLAEKMLEYVLETRVDAQEDGAELDVFLEDLVLTHIIYLPTNTLCNYLKHYYSQTAEVEPRHGRA